MLTFCLVKLVKDRLEENGNREHTSSVEFRSDWSGAEMSIAYSVTIYGQHVAFIRAYSMAGYSDSPFEYSPAY